MTPVSDVKTKIDELATLMDEYGLETARIKEEDFSVEFSVHPPTPATNGIAIAAPTETSEEKTVKKPAKKTSAPKKSSAPAGTPVTSPMTGIFYAASSPGTPPFAKEGDQVQAGQVVGLIEAMKVFNEITAPSSGTVTKVAIENGQLVNPGDAILYIS